MGAYTLNLTGSKTYTFLYSGSASVWFSNDDVFSAMGVDKPPVGATITSAYAKFEIKRATGSTGASWSIADDNKSGATTVLASGSLGTSYAWKPDSTGVNLLSKGVVPSKFSQENGYKLLTLNHTYLRFKGEVKTLSGIFRNCQITYNWNNVTTAVVAEAGEGGTVAISNYSLSGCTRSGNNITFTKWGDYFSCNITATAKTGYTFDHWENRNGSKKTDKLASTSVSGMGSDADTEFYYKAVFVPITYTATFNYHGGSKSVSFTTGQTPSFGGTPADYEDDNYYYRFSHWSPTPSAVTSDVTYTAVYTSTAKAINNIYVGGSKVNKIYIGNTEVKAVYVGTTKVYG